MNADTAATTAKVRELMLAFVRDPDDGERLLWDTLTAATVALAWRLDETPREIADRLFTFMPTAEEWRADPLPPLHLADPATRMES